MTVCPFRRQVCFWFNSEIGSFAKYHRGSGILYFGARASFKPDNISNMQKNLARGDGGIGALTIFFSMTSDLVVLLTACVAFFVIHSFQSQRVLSGEVMPSVF